MSLKESPFSVAWPCSPSAAARANRLHEADRVHHNNAADFWTIARKGTEADAALADISRVPSGDGTAAAQKRILDDLLAKAWTASPSAPWIRRTRRRC
jgi:hypothetical protein